MAAPFATGARGRRPTRTCAASRRSRALRDAKTMALSTVLRSEALRVVELERQSRSVRLACTREAVADSDPISRAWTRKKARLTGARSRVASNTEIGSESI